jgi:hypothetical protein
MRKLIAFLLAATTVVAISGCGGDADDIFGESNPRIRVFNALRGDTNVIVTANGTQIGGGSVGRGQESLELETGPGTYDIEITRASDGVVLQRLEDQLLETNSNYVVIPFNSNLTEDGVAARILRENEDAVGGQAEVTFVRATNHLGDVDVYLIPQGGTIDQQVAMARLGSTAEDDEVFTVNPGNYEVRVYNIGETTGALYTENVSLETDANYMLILAARREGEAVNTDIYQYRER